MADRISLGNHKEGEVESPEENSEQDEVSIEVERIISQASVSVLGQDKPDTIT